MSRSEFSHASSAISRRSLGLAGLALTGGAIAATAGAAPTAEAAAPHRLDAPDEIASVTALRGRAGTSAGEQVLLLGYYDDTPGRGGGVVYWDAGSTESDDGGTVFAVAGVSTGRWKRAYAARIDLAWFGWRGTGTVGDDDGPRVQHAIGALPLGGTVEFGPGLVRLESTVHVTSAPIVFAGASNTGKEASDTAPKYASQVVVATKTADGFVLTGVQGGGFRDMQIRGENLTGGSLIRTEPNGTVLNYMVSFYNVRFLSGYNGISLRGCNTFRFQNCVWNGFTGQQVILLNGVDDANHADPVEFVQCAISAGSDPTNLNTDNVVIDGQGGSIKFLACAVLFGHHGVWMRKQTAGGVNAPKFLYFEGGGFENNRGIPVFLEIGAQAQFTNAYIGATNDADNVRIGPDFTSSVQFSNCIIRAAGRHGMDIASTRVTVTGCIIGNNGRNGYAGGGHAVTGAANNGSGALRITTGDAHNWETGDRVTIQGVTGTTEANGTWSITVVDATHFDLDGSTFTHTYAGGGTAFRLGSGINIRSTATRVVVVGNAIGGLGEGTNRQDYGIRCASADVLISANELTGNNTGPYLLTGTQTRDTRICGNKGIVQLDGWLTARIAGPVADGRYDFGNLTYLDAQRIQVVRVTRKAGAGTGNVRLDVDGATAGGSALAVSATLQSTDLAVPPVVDGTGAAKHVQVEVLGSSGLSDLDVQFGYQILS